MFMPTPASDTLQYRQLAHLTAMTIELAQDLHASALAAEGEEKARLSRAYDHTARGARMCIALQMKLVRQHDQSEREAARELREALQLNPDRQTRRRAQRGEVCDVIEPMIWNEREHLEARALQNRFNVWLEAQMARPDFEDDNPDGLIEEAARILGIRFSAEDLYEDDEAEGEDEDPPSDADSS